MRPLLFALACSVLLLASARSAGGSGESLNRPLHLAHVAPGAACPVSGGTRAVFAGRPSSQWLIGKGPAYLITVAGVPAGSVDVSQSPVDAAGWRGQKAPWSVRGYWGPLLIRGARLDAPGEVSAEDQPRRSMMVALAMPPPSHIVWRP